MTMGANAVAILEIPKGCIRKSRMSMPQLVPTIVEVEMSFLTILRLLIRQYLDLSWIATRDTPLNGPQNRLCRCQYAI